MSMLIIALGYTFKKLNIIKEDDGDGMSRLIFNITLPSLIIVTFNSIKIDSSLILIAMISMVFGFFMSALGIFIFRKEPGKLRGTFSMLVPAFNVGLFAYPIVESIWGSKALKYFGMFDMGNSIITFGACYLIAAYFSSSEVKIEPKDILKKLLTSIPLMSYIVTLAINLAGFHYPSAIISICSTLSKANMPLSLLLLGICLNFSIDKTYYKNMLKVLLVRYGVGLAIGILLFSILPYNSLFRYTLLIGLTLPLAMAVVPYSVQFGYDKRLVGTVCSISIILSFLLTWIIISI